MRTLILWLWVAAAAMLMACGGSSKKTETPTTVGSRTLEFTVDDGTQPVPNSCDTPLDGAAMTREVVVCNVRQLRARVNGCYEHELELDGTLEGTLTVSFTITASGTVMAPSARGMGDQRLTSCVEAIFAKASFPPSSGSTIVSYPFALAPSR